jgi:hypothetical protein
VGAGPGAQYALDMEKTGSSLARRALAVVILGVAAWLLLKVVIGLIATVAWIVVAVIAVVGVLWALNTLF